MVINIIGNNKVSKEDREFWGGRENVLERRSVWESI